MSNDLISRSALIKSIKKWLPSDPCGKEQSIREEVATNLAVSMLMEIEEAPTAYDVDVVCEKIKGVGTSFCSAVSCNEECSDCDHGALMKTLVEIVRNGGKKVSILEQILQEIEKIKGEHLYKVAGDYETYSQYNEAWQDCAYRIESVIEAMIPENDG